MAAVALSSGLRWVIHAPWMMGFCSKLSGFTEREMLRTWSTLLTVISVCGVIISLLGTIVLPLR